MIALLLLACRSDPCAWAYGDWTQRSATMGDATTTGFEAYLALDESGFGYQPESRPTAESATLTAMDDACETIEVLQGDRRFRIERDGDGLVLRTAPKRAFGFSRSEL
ncbi:MAG: hypothetical protein GY871_15325 [Actinomycetales bacterium]|nr:hypothetical protein [Actinomycetales bacterium]